MANIGAILKALATWQPTSGLSRQQLAQDFGRTSRFATFDQKPNRAPVVNADVPPDRPELSMIDAPISQPAQTTGINLMGDVPGQPSNEPQVQQFNPEPMPEGQALPDELPQANPALLAALNQNQGGVQPWERAYAGTEHAPMPWAPPMPRINFGNIDVQGGGTPEAPSDSMQVFEQLSVPGGGGSGFAPWFPAPRRRADEQFGAADSEMNLSEDDMMRRSREYQDMVLNLLARSRGNG